MANTKTTLIVADARPLLTLAISVLSGNPIPSIHLTEIGLQLMKKLGIEADVGYFRRLNRDGKSTQVPMRDVIAVSKPVTRKIGWGKKELIYEKL